MGEHDCQRIDESAVGKWVTRGLDGLVLHFTDTSSASDRSGCTNRSDFKARSDKRLQC